MIATKILGQIEPSTTYHDFELPFCPNISGNEDITVPWTVDACRTNISRNSLDAKLQREKKTQLFNFESVGT